LTRQCNRPRPRCAAKALDELDRKDVQEIKALPQPPTPIMIVCMCIVILRPLGKEEETLGWNGAKAMLGDMGFMNALLNYKRDEMREKQIRKIKELLGREKEIFSGQKMKTVSVAG